MAKSIAGRRHKRRGEGGRQSPRLTGIPCGCGGDVENGPVLRLVLRFVQAADVAEAAGCRRSCRSPPDKIKIFLSVSFPLPYLDSMPDVSDPDRTGGGRASDQAIEPRFYLIRRKIRRGCPEWRIFSYKQRIYTGDIGCPHTPRCAPYQATCTVGTVILSGKRKSFVLLELPPRQIHP